MSSIMPFRVHPGTPSLLQLTLSYCCHGIPSAPPSVLELPTFKGFSSKMRPLDGQVGLYSITPATSRKVAKSTRENLSLLVVTRRQMTLLECKFSSSILLFWQPIQLNVKDQQLKFAYVSLVTCPSSACCITQEPGTGFKLSIPLLSSLCRSFQEVTKNRDENSAVCGRGCSPKLGRSIRM